MASEQSLTLPLNNTTYWVQLHHDGVTGLTVTLTNTATGDSYSGAINTCPITGFTPIPNHNPRLRLGAIPNIILFETLHIANVTCDPLIQQNQDAVAKINKRLDYIIWQQGQFQITVNNAQNQTTNLQANINAQINSLSTLKRDKSDVEFPYIKVGHFTLTSECHKPNADVCALCIRNPTHNTGDKRHAFHYQNSKDY